MDRNEGHNGIAPISSVTTVRCTNFAKSGRPDIGPNVEKLELFLDFASVTTNSVRKDCNKWNKRAGEVFTDAFIAKYPEDAPNAAVVRSCFLSHLRQLRTHFEIYTEDK